MLSPPRTLRHLAGMGFIVELDDGTDSARASTMRCADVNHPNVARQELLDHLHGK